MGNKTRAAQQTHRQDAAVEHHLVSIDLMPAPFVIHSYVMTNDPKAIINGVTNKMMSVIEEQFGPGVPLLPVALDTILSTGVDLVRSSLGELHPEMAKTWEKATTFHLSMFLIGKDDPINIKLMELH